MAFRRVEEPTLERSFHRATATDLVGVRLLSAKVFSDEIARTMGSGGLRAGDALSRVNTALDVALTEREALGGGAYLPAEPHEEQTVTEQVRAWFRGASRALGLSRIMQELLGTDIDTARHARVDFNWAEISKGGVHLARSALRTLGLANPTGGAILWYEGHEVFAAVSAYKPTQAFATASPGIRAAFVTAQPVIKRGVWESLGNGHTGPNGQND